MEFIGIQSLDELIKKADMPQTAIPGGHLSGDAAADIPSMVTPVPSIKLPAASKKSTRKYPGDISDDAKIRTQGEEDLPSGNSL